MKKITLYFLLLAGTGKTLYAQNNFGIYNPQLNSESIFNTPKPGGLLNNFEFILPKGNRMMLELSSIHQLKRFPNIDSLLKKVLVDLEPFKDSINNQLSIKRIDCIVGATNNKIRIIQHQPTADYYSIKNKEVTQLKTDQDTLRIRLMLPSYVKGVIINGEKKTELLRPCFVTLIVNNIDDLKNLQENYFTNAINNLLMKDLQKAFSGDKEKWESGTYYALYSIEANKRFIPDNIRHFAWGRSRGLDVAVSVGLQYAKGSWISSAAVGLSYFAKNSNGNKNSFSILYEPYFFFSKDISNNTVVNRNDFIAFAFHNEFKVYNTPKINYQNISLGYLVNRNGNWLEKNTFKFTLPGLQTKNVLLEPEFIFNDFFKNFTPSLKLSLHFE
ncbi:MAG: hypothetical protein JST94_11580 [Bacteroidetes bacterium]|nr:hypothetical protein [Bacteroidota bacterium]MBS1641011.1 hypothetical protein [Bacteroidota bacterium]MBS1672067.1 hypothetical protein [Bacteroidota bacterium]